MEILNKRILVIAAHPDDEVYGMGGTMAKLSAKNEVYTLIITEGCSTQYKGNLEILNIKKEEALKANKILGVKKVIFGDLPDMRLDTISHIEINALIEKTIDEIKPHIVFTHHHGDVNKDHKLVNESTLVATRPVYGQCVESVFTYSVPSSTEWGIESKNNIFIPNVFSAIENYYEKKQSAILAYESELREYPHPRSIKVIESYDKTLGYKLGCKKVEGLSVIRHLI